VSEQEPYLSQIKKCVTFFFEKENDVIKPLGTGFFVGIGDMQAGYVTYLVTAKHLISHTAGIYPEVLLSLNTREGHAEAFPFIIASDKVLKHPDKDVDIVCIPCSPDSKKYDFKFITDPYLSDKELLSQKKIREGNNIFYAGLFNPYFGNRIVEPLVRFGKVSSLTNEKIRITYPEDQPRFAHLYLFECHSLGGFSGSPVFFEIDRLNTAGQIHYGNPEIYLAGVMKGHYDEFVTNPVLNTKDDIVRELNLGISMVTPCYLLKEILFSPSEVKAREDLKKASIQKPAS
jgi:hypothetical protein